MQKKVAFLVSQVQLRQQYEPDVLDRLAKSASLVFHEGERRPSVHEAQELLKGAAIAVTSWGSPQMTQDLLDHAPQLELVVHAAGSVKSVVSDALYDRGIVVTSGAAA